MSDGKNRSVSLPAGALELFKQQADARGISVSAWLVEAGQRQRAREAAESFAEAVQRPDVAAELAEIEEAMQPLREGRRMWLASRHDAA